MRIKLVFLLPFLRGTSTMNVASVEIVNFLESVFRRSFLISFMIAVLLYDSMLLLFSQK